MDSLYIFYFLHQNKKQKPPAARLIIACPGADDTSLRKENKMMKKLLCTALLAAMLFALSGCAANDKPAATPEAILQSILDEIGDDNLPALTAADDELLKNFYGIDSADLDSYALQMAAINVQADEFFIAKVKDGKMDTIKAGIEKRKQDLDNTWKQYLPAVYETVQNSKTVENGGYILFVVSENAATAEKVFNDATK